MNKGEQTRRKIIARAAPVFNTRGFAGTSMGDLIQATGLEKGGIYNHFASKEALALAAFDYAVEQISQRFLVVLEGKELAYDRLMAIIGVFERQAINPELPGGCPVLNTAVEADDTMPILQARAQHAMTSWQKLIGVTVKAGIQRQELRPDVDPYEVSSIITSILEGALMLTRLYNDPTHIYHAIKHLDHYLQTLLLPSK